MEPNGRDKVTELEREGGKEATRYLCEQNYVWFAAASWAAALRGQRSAAVSQGALCCWGIQTGPEGQHLALK